MTFEPLPVRGVWIPYDGKGCPVPLKTRVRIRCRDGWEGPECGAERADWYDWAILDDNDDITHYMIVEG